MTTYRGLTELVQKTIHSVIDAEDAEDIRFNVQLQARLAKQVTSLDRLNAAVATCDETMTDYIRRHEEEPRAIHYARGALLLKKWLMRPPPGPYRDNGRGGFTPRV